MYIIIAGAGDIGFFLAQKLIEDKHQVCCVEKRRDRADFIAQTTSIPVLQGRATDLQVLKDARIEKADTFVALTSEDQSNIVSCQIAKELFEVKRTVAKVNNPQYIKVFSNLGIDIPIDSTAILSRIVEEEASFTDFINLLSIKKGKLSITRVDLSEESPVVNRKVKDISLPPDTVLVSLLRGDEVIVPRGDTVLLTGDEVLAITNIQREKELITTLIGKI
jgi:trk system potassium uptake protein